MFVGHWSLLESTFFPILLLFQVMVHFFLPYKVNFQWKKQTQLYDALFSCLRNVGGKCVGANGLPKPSPQTFWHGQSNPDRGTFFGLAMELADHRYCGGCQLGKNIWSQPTIAKIIAVKLLRLQARQHQPQLQHVHHTMTLLLVVGMLFTSARCTWNYICRCKESTRATTCIPIKQTYHKTLPRNVIVFPPSCLGAGGSTGTRLFLLGSLQAQTLFILANLQVCFRGGKV